MNKVTGLMLILLLLPVSACAEQTEETNRPPRAQGRMKPPPEAIAACQGKTEGTSVQFTTPRGDTFKGICRSFEGVLAAMPERGGPRPKNSRNDDSNSTKSSD